MIKPSPFRLVVRTSSFHVEDTGSIPVRDNLLGEASEGKKGWAFPHSSSAPAVEIGAIWPPKGVEVLNSQGIPFLNTLILLLSGAAVTWAHYAILAGLK